MAGSRRSATLELAVLGLLHESPLHGYELRKRLARILGAFRAVSFGSLYPCLRALEQRGWVSSREHTEPGRRRTKVIYRLTDAGQDGFEAMLARADPAAYEDGAFDVHFMFFGQASRDVRLRILNGRRSRMEERLDAAREDAAERRRRTDTWSAELHRHGLETAEREVRWLTELIEAEQGRLDPRT